MEREPIQQAPSSQTRDALLDAALAEFNQNGYFNTSVDSITKRAGVSHGTFYLYFKNKQNVLMVLMDRIVEKVSIIIGDGHGDAGFLDPQNPAAFEQDMQRIVAVILDSSGLFKAFIQGMVHSKEIFAQFAGVSRTIGDVFLARLNQKQADGAGARIDALTLSRIMSIMFYLSTFIYSIGIIQCAPDVMVRHVATVLFSVLNFNEKSMKARKKKSEVRKAALIRTRKELITMAREEFSRHGYFDTKVSDIAQKVGYSRGTFYQYYTDKDDIVQAILLDMFYQNRDQASIVDLVVTNLDVAQLDDLIRISSIVINIFEKYSSFSWALLQGAFYSEKLSRFYEQMFMQFSKPVQEKIIEQQQDGACQGLDPLITAEIILTTVSYAIFMFFGGLINCSQEVFSENMGIFLYSMLNFVNSRE